MRFLLFTLKAILIVVLLFGGRKIPELMKGLGQGMKEFKKATKDEDKNSDVKDPDKRGAGFGIGFLATVGLILTAFWGVVTAL